MKQVTLNIPEDKFSFFMQLVKSLNFVQVAEREPAESQLTAEQRETWETIRAGFQELKDVDAGKRQARPVDDLLRELDAPA